MHRYLGPDPESELARIRGREPEWLALADEVASFSGGLINSLVVPHANMQLFLAAILLRRIVGCLEAVLLLAERGMHTEGLTMRRALLEALFILGAVRNQPSLVETYLAMDNHRRRDIFKNLKKLGAKRIQALAPEFTPEMIDKTIAALEKEAKATSYLGPDRFAQAAKLYDLYLTDYSFLSEAAHHAGKDLERNIATNENNEVDGLYWGPEENPPSDLLYPALDQTLMAASIAMKLFKIAIPAQLKSLVKQLNELRNPKGNSS